MLLTLTDKESKAFYEVINAELHCCINEYDYETKRCPGKKRIKDSQYAKSIVEKWEQTQDITDIINGMKMINIDTIKSCTIDLNEKEQKYSKNLLDKHIKNCYKELSTYTMPYTGVLKDINDIAYMAEIISAKLE